MKYVEAREPPSMAEAETYWKPLRTEEAQHNERSIRIRREQKRKISHMDWRSIQISEIALYLLKFTIGKLLILIKYKVTVLRLSHLLTSILKELQYNNRGTGEGI